jgi:hypothetical protein
MGGGIEGGSWPGNLPRPQSALISSALILLYPVAVSLEKSFKIIINWYICLLKFLLISNPPINDHGY